MTPEELAEGRRLEAAATKGPWRAKCSGHDYPYIEAETGWQAGCGEDFAKMPDADLIVWLRNNASTLLDAAEERDRYRTALEDAVENCGHNPGGVLDVCTEWCGVPDCAIRDALYPPDIARAALEGRDD